MTLAAYSGHEPLTFTDYLDLGTGRTLHAVPGGIYDIIPAGGRAVPDVPWPWFTPYKRLPPPPAAELADELIREALDGEQAPGEDPETGE